MHPLTAAEPTTKLIASVKWLCDVLGVFRILNARNVPLFSIFLVQ